VWREGNKSTWCFSFSAKALGECSKEGSTWVEGKGINKWTTQGKGTVEVTQKIRSNGLSLLPEAGRKGKEKKKVLLGRGWTHPGMFETLFLVLVINGEPKLAFPLGEKKKRRPEKTKNIGNNIAKKYISEIQKATGSIPGNHAFDQ